MKYKLKPRLQFILLSEVKYQLKVKLKLVVQSEVNLVKQKSEGQTTDSFTTVREVICKVKAKLQLVYKVR